MTKVLVYPFEGHDYSGKSTAIETVKCGLESRFTDSKVVVLTCKAPYYDSATGRLILEHLAQDTPVEAYSDAHAVNCLKTASLYSYNRCTMYKELNKELELLPAALGYVPDVAVVLMDRSWLSSLAIPFCAEDTEQSVEEYIQHLRNLEDENPLELLANRIFLMEVEDEELLRRMGGREEEADAHESWEHVTKARWRMQVAAKAYPRLIVPVGDDKLAIANQIAADVSALLPVPDDAYTTGPLVIAPNVPTTVR